MLTKQLCGSNWLPTWFLQGKNADRNDLGCMAVTSQISNTATLIYINWLNFVKARSFLRGWLSFGMLTIKFLELDQGGPTLKPWSHCSAKVTKGPLSLPIPSVSTHLQPAYKYIRMNKIMLYLVLVWRKLWHFKNKLLNG